MTPSRDKHGKKKRLQQELYRDDAYVTLNSEFNAQNYEKCIELIEELRNRYPESREIRQYQEEIEIRILLKRLFRIKVRNTRIRNVVIAVGIILVIGIVFYIVFSSFSNFRQVIAEQLMSEEEIYQQSKEDALASLVIQAENLLESQNLTLADSVIAEIEEIDAEDPNLPVLIATQTFLHDLDLIYEDAQEEASLGNLDEALLLYQSVQAQILDFRDVNYQISVIEQQIEIREKLQLGEQAYQESNWPVVISEYEEVLALDSSFLNGQIKGELVNSYIESIVLMLNEEETTIEDIQKAESYYKRSLALIPQSKSFEEERKTLDNLILNLLIVKYLEYADTLIDQSPFDEDAIKTALKYLNNAYHLDPDNGSLENQVNKTQYYYVGLQNFYDLDWDECISVLEQLRATDPEFGNQIGNYVLYEAYMAYGNQRSSYGLYLDAKSHFEDAEFLVWDNEISTPTRLFSTQLKIAYSAGMSHSYEQSVSYYEYAIGEFLNMSNLRRDYENFGKLTKAEAFAAESLYFDAFFHYADFFESATDVVYDYFEVEVVKGESLLSIAKEHGTTIQEIIDSNELPQQIMIISSDQTLLIPILP